jgi:putative transposase
MRNIEIASVRKRYGYHRIHVLLLREGWEINHKRFYRLYRQEGSNLRKPVGRKKISVSRTPEKGLASAVNDCWCMDFSEVSQPLCIWLSIIKIYINDIFNFRTVSLT